MTKEETLTTAYQPPEKLSQKALEIVQMMELQIFKDDVYGMRDEAVKDAAKGLLTADELTHIKAAAERIAPSKRSLFQS